MLPLLFIAKAYSFQNEGEHKLLKIPEKIAPRENQSETKDYSFDSNARKVPGSEYKWLPMWVTDSPLNIPRASPAVAVENGFIYVLGGGNFDQDHIFHSSVEYAKVQPDGSLGEWRLTSPMKTKRMFAAAIAANGYIYVIGGEKGNDESRDLLQTVEKAKILPDGSLGEWTLEAQKMNTNRRALVASYYKGWIYAFGGYNGSFLKDMERTEIKADGSLGEWALEGEEAKIERYIHSGVINKNNIYLFGGHTMTLEKATDTAEWTTINSDGKLGSWKDLPVMPTNRFAGGAVVLQDIVFLIGGQNTIILTAVTKAPIAPDGSLGEWITDTPLPQGRLGVALAVWNDVIYVIGGSHGKQYLREVLRTHYTPGKNLGVWVNDPVLIAKAKENKNTPPTDASNHIHMGWKRYIAKRYDEAITELKLGIKVKPDHAPSHNLLGVVYQAKKMYHEAIDHFKESIELSPKNFQGYYQLGKLYHEIMLIKQAEEMYRKTARLKPEFAPAKVKLFQLLIGTNRCNEAMLELEPVSDNDLKISLNNLIKKNCY